MGTQDLFAPRLLPCTPGQRTKLLTIRFGISLHELVQRWIAFFEEPGAPTLVLLFPGDAVDQRAASGCHRAPNRFVILGSQYLRNQPLLPTTGPNLQALANVDRLSELRRKGERIESRRREGNQIQNKPAHLPGLVLHLRATRRTELLFEFGFSA